MNWTDCPLVERDPLKLSGVPIVRGTRVQADAILENYQDGLSVKEISTDFSIEESVIARLLSFAKGQRIRPAS